MGCGVQVCELNTGIDAVGIGIDGSEEAFLGASGVPLCEVAPPELEEDVGVRFLGDGAEELIIDLGFVDEVVFEEVACEVANQKGERRCFGCYLRVRRVDALEMVLLLVSGHACRSPTQFLLRTNASWLSPAARR